MATLPLHPIKLGPEYLNVPLPFNLYNRQGTLIASRGSVITCPQRLLRLSAQRLCRPANQEDARLPTPLGALDHIARQFHELLHVPGAPLSRQLPAIADALLHHVYTESELCVGMANRLHLKNVAVRHALFAATIGILIGRDLGVTERKLEVLARAALTMNLASFELQNRLATSVVAPDDDQRAALQQHPADSIRLLMAAGVSDIDWLTAVAQHHENMDGSGYPDGVAGDDIVPEARVLRVADVWCSLLSHRHQRIAKYPSQAMHETFARERRRLDYACMLSLRKLMGHYPPGTLVRLHNRETAVVTRRFPGKPTPEYVISILRPSGEPFRDPQLRKTSSGAHAIRDYTYFPLVPPAVDWARVWAIG